VAPFFLNTVYIEELTNCACLVARHFTLWNLLIDHHDPNLSSGSPAFCFSVPQIWNSLPFCSSEPQSLPAIKCHLKTHVLQSAYPTL